MRQLVYQAIGILYIRFIRLLNVQIALLAQLFLVQAKIPEFVFALPQDTMNIRGCKSFD
jgi:hypothetical protein